MNKIKEKGGHTTNYFNTFIEISEDCPINCGEMPPEKIDNPSIASLQYNLIKNNPYEFTSDDVVFKAYFIKNNFHESEFLKRRSDFFSKGQACMRSSPLTKRYGWGVHSDEDGKMAIFGSDTEAYKKLIGNPAVQKVKAMRNKRKI